MTFQYDDTIIYCVLKFHIVARGGNPTIENDVICCRWQRQSFWHIFNGKIEIGFSAIKYKQYGSQDIGFNVLNEPKETFIASNGIVSEISLQNKIALLHDSA